jgi:glycosyltransferase involved in cell wall biosynthesis
MTKISVVINTLNEEKNLPRALESVKNFADEVVVVDMYSNDKTVEVAERYGAKIFEHDRTGYVEPARNYAIGKATGDWILILDADEKLTKPLRQTLKSISRKSRSHYFRLPRKNIIFGKWIRHSGWWPDYNIRFFKKGHVEWNEIIHSVPTTTGKGEDLPAKLENAIVHYHYTSISQYISRLNRYTDQQEKLKTKEGYEFHWQDLITKPTNQFLSRFFMEKGYEDGLHGLALSGLQAFSEFVLYLKLWEKEGFIRKKLDVSEVISIMKVSKRDISYWFADTLLKVEGGVVNKVRRKLKL